MKCKRCNYELTRGLVVGTAIGILAMLVVVAIMFGAGCRQAKPADPQEFIDRRVPEIKRLIAECQEFHGIPRVTPLAIRFDDISEWAWMHPRYRLTIAVAHAPGVVTFDESMPQPPLPRRWVDAVCHEAVHWEQMNRVGLAQFVVDYTRDPRPWEDEATRMGREFAEWWSINNLKGQSDG
jgi:hypothetical protein